MRRTFSPGFKLYLFSLCEKYMGLSGLEPPTSRLSGVRSNRLSYNPLMGPAATYSPVSSPIQYLRPIWSSPSCSGWKRVLPHTVSPPEIFGCFIVHSFVQETPPYSNRLASQVASLAVWRPVAFLISVFLFLNPCMQACRLSKQKSCCTHFNNWTVMQTLLIPLERR